MRIAICDDDIVYLQSAQDFAMAWKEADLEKQISFIRTFRSTEDLLEEWEKGTIFDIIFLDIQIPGEMSGLDLARKIRESNEQVIIVFITNYSNFVYSGYEVNALRYLRKPFTAKQMEECLDIAFRRWRLIQDKVLTLDVNKEIIIIPHREILYIEVQGHYIKIMNVYGNEYRVRNSISVIRNKLPDELFVLCHRSFIVNLMYVRKLTRTSITLINNVEVPIGIKQKANVENKFMAYYQGDIV